MSVWSEGNLTQAGGEHANTTGLQNLKPYVLILAVELPVLTWNLPNDDLLSEPIHVSLTNLVIFIEVNV